MVSIELPQKASADSTLVSRKGNPWKSTRGMQCCLIVAKVAQRKAPAECKSRLLFQGNPAESARPTRFPANCIQTRASRRVCTAFAKESKEKRSICGALFNCFCQRGSNGKRVWPHRVTSQRSQYIRSCPYACVAGRAPQKRTANVSPGHVAGVEQPDVPTGASVRSVLLLQPCARGKVFISRGSQKFVKSRCVDRILI